MSCFAKVLVELPRGENSDALLRTNGSSVESHSGGPSTNSVGTYRKELKIVFQGPGGKLLGVNRRGTGREGLHRGGAGRSAQFAQPLPLGARWACAVRCCKQPSCAGEWLGGCRSTLRSQWSKRPQGPSTARRSRRPPGRRRRARTTASTQRGARRRRGRHGRWPESTGSPTARRLSAPSRAAARSLAPGTSSPGATTAGRAGVWYVQSALSAR